MRFTTRLFALISMLVALAIFAILLGSIFSFVYQSDKNSDQHMRVLATSLDQSLLVQSPEMLDNWLPKVMGTLGIVCIIMISWQFAAKYWSYQRR